jgi:hypothetical protein
VLRHSFGFGELRPLLTRHGIDACVVVQTVCVGRKHPSYSRLRRPSLA